MQECLKLKTARQLLCKHKHQKAENKGVTKKAAKTIESGLTLRALTKSAVKNLSKPIKKGYRYIATSNYSEEEDSNHAKTIDDTNSDSKEVIKTCHLSKEIISKSSLFI